VENLEQSMSIKPKIAL